MPDSNRRSLSPKAIWKLVGISLVSFILLLSALLLLVFRFQQKPRLGVVLSAPVEVVAPEAETTIHAFPETSDGIYVFNDQLSAWDMSEAQFEFAATHYVGTQKAFLSDVRRLRAHNPDFVVLNYRLGLGLGYQNTNEDCEPNGVWVEVIEGERSVREFPDDPPDEWFYKEDGQRVFFCKWGWYLMDISNLSWQAYWKQEVLRQLQSTTADGIFVDGLFPPNYYGGDQFEPALPDVDMAFEESWASAIEEFIARGQSGDLAPYYFIPNVGEWVTGRDQTDYSVADGLMVEGFGRWDSGEYFSPQTGDWQLQMDRILGMIHLDKILLLQQYVDPADVDDRMFLLGNYLLVKGRYTYINLDVSAIPEWFPEYEIPIGAPLGNVPLSVSDLWRSDWGLYARVYENGLVLVNPYDKQQVIQLPKTYYQAFPVGGGIVPLDGNISGWEVDYIPVADLVVAPNRAVILLDSLP